MLYVRELGKQYSGERLVEAVSDVSFELERGRFLAIVGRSGSGKSTLLAMIGGISRPTCGSVCIDGKDQWALTDTQRADFRNTRIGFVFQFASLLPTLRAIDNVALPALVGGQMDFQEAYARARKLLENVGLNQRVDAYPGELSGGEKRRVAIARALINSPELLLADEPTADLDEATEEEILNLLVDVHRAFQLTLVVVTHNKTIAARADQILEMRAGGGAMSPVCWPAAEPGARTDFSAQSERVKGIFASPAELVASEQVPLGAGVERFLGRIVLTVLPILFMVWGSNAALAFYQRSMIDARIAQRQALEDMAMRELRADVKAITLGAGKTYKLSLYLRNTTGRQPIYVMAPTVRGFVQVGSSWQEVPLKPAQSSAPQVMKITGEQVLDYVLEPDLQDFAQLIPYYMHVRLSNDLLVSPRSEPKDDLIERNDNYYVYLKPHDADDRAILAKVKFPGRPPVWIPMPPH